MQVGVVGCGYWGAKHVRVLHSLAGVDGVTLIDPVQEKCAALSRLFSGLPSFRDLESALDHVDAVIISTPPTTHADLALTALTAGKHVLVEKPLATSVLDAGRMIKEAENANKTLMVGHTLEYNAAAYALRELVRSGDLGQVYYMNTSRLNLGLYQNDCNVVWDLAPHDVSLLNYLLGSVPASVESWGSRHAHVLHEDVAYLRLRYTELGVTANVHVSWLDPCKVRRVTIVGSERMAVYDDLAIEERVRIYDKGVVSPTPSEQDLPNNPMSYRYGDVISPFIAFEEPLGVQDRHFVECVAMGTHPRTDGLNGLSVVKVLEAADRSMHLGTPAEVDQDEGFEMTSLASA